MKLLALSLFCWAPLIGASIEGRVTNSVTGEGVPGTKVRVLDRHSSVLEAVTDSSGLYRSTGLADGDYRVEFSKDGYSDNTSMTSPLQQVMLAGGYLHASGDVPARQDALLQPWGGLRGRVVDEDGKPAAKVRVRIEPAGETNERTDENGEFAFEGLAPGSYKLVAKPEAKTRIEDGVQVGAVPTYYPSVTDPADAAPIAMSWGATVSGIVIRLKSVPVHRVAGVVLNVAGEPVTHATVKLLGRAGPAQKLLGGGAVVAGPEEPVVVLSPREAMNLLGGISTTVGPGPELELASVESGDDGSFEFPAVQQGEWRLSVEAGVDDDKPLAGIALANVADKDIEDLRVRVVAPVTLEAITDWGSTQASNNHEPPWSMLSLIALEDQPQVRLFRGRVTHEGGTSGFFPGRYLVTSAFSPPGYYVASVIWGGREVLGRVVDLGEGSGTFQVMLKNDTGTLRGTVDRGDGASLFLVNELSGGIVQYREDVAGTTGTFQFENIAPGDYYVVAFDRVPYLDAASRGLPPADLAGSIISLATRVRVEANSAAPVDLKVNRWPW
jgi:hypothetical protein